MPFRSDAEHKKQGGSYRPSRPVRTITSLKAKEIQFARSLNTAKGRIAQKKFLIEGVEALRWALDAAVEVQYVLVAPGQDIPGGIPAGIDILRVSAGLLKKVTGTAYVIPVVAVGQSHHRQTAAPFEIVLDGVHDVGNIGTIIRTCHAFGIKSILSTTPTFDLFHRKTVRASRGTVFSTHCRRFDSPHQTIDYLKRHDYYIVVTSPYGEQIQSLTELPDTPVALVVGNETDGVSDAFLQQADVCVQIPIQRHVESLNVGVATGISLYELTFKQVIGMIEKRIKSTLGRDVNVTAMLIQEVLNKELKRVSDLSSAQLVFLMVLKCDAIMSIREMQQQFGIPDDDVDSFLSPLMKKHLVRTDDRGNLMISEAGTDTLGKLWPIVENAENRVLHAFSDQEKAELRAYLTRLRENCVEIIHRPLPIRAE
jgi:RNA methyltransferase, TrmH family